MSNEDIEVFFKEDDATLLVVFEEIEKNGKKTDKWNEENNLESEN